MRSNAMVNRYIAAMIDNVNRGEMVPGEAIKKLKSIETNHDRQEDYTQYRVSNRITETFPDVMYSNSPEDIVIAKERIEVLSEYIEWISQLLGGTDWQLFKDYVLHGMSYKAIADKYDMTVQASRSNIQHSLKIVRATTPFYKMDIKEYLEDS